MSQICVTHFSFKGLEVKSSIMCRVWFIFILGIYSCSGVIYHLNETEYQRMPPLSALDEYESCLSEEGGVYCFMQLSLHADPGNELMQMITEYSNQKIKHYNHSILDRGVCVRKTCQKFIGSLNTTVELTRSLEKCLNESLWREYRLNAKVSKVYYCDKHDEPMDINAMDWIVLAVILGIVVINIVGSFYDYIAYNKNEDVGNAYILNFSTIRNWRWLMGAESNDPNTQYFQSIHGVRVILNLLMILAHVMLLISTGHTTNPHEFEKSFDLPPYQLLYSGLMVTQVFFFISGFLTVYYLQIEEQTRRFTPWDIPKIILLRFLRLAPVLAMALAISVTWVRHFGSGPLWKLFVTDNLVAGCREYWWHTLFFINNYMPKNQYCLIPTWHIAADMQVFLVGITAYILTSGRMRYWVLGSLLALGVAIPAVHTVLQDLDPIVIMFPESYRTFENATFRYQYIPGHNNIPCFIMGMVAATVFYKCQKRGYIVNNKLFSYLLCLAVVSFPLIFYSGHIFFEDGKRPSLLFRAVYSSAIRPVLGVMCMLALPGLLTNTSSTIKSVLEWRYWLVPSRVSYCVYMLHMILVHIMLGSRTQLSTVSYTNVATAHLIITLLSYLIAIMAYLMVEAPCTKVIKHLMGKRTLSSNKTNGIKNGKSL